MTILKFLLRLYFSLVFFLELSLISLPRKHRCFQHHIAFTLPLYCFGGNWKKNTLLSKLKKEIEMYTWIAMPVQAEADCLTFVTEERRRKKYLHRPGIEPGPPAWQASILPLNQRCSLCFQGIYFSLFICGIHGDILFAGLISRRYLLDLQFVVRSAMTCSFCPLSRGI